MLKNLLRPKWQHPDTAVRRRAVKDEDIDSDALFELAKTDPDSEVRALAVTRIKDLRKLLTIADARGEPADTALSERVLVIILEADSKDEPDVTFLRRCYTLCSGDEQRRLLLTKAPYVTLRLIAAENSSEPEALALSAVNDKSSKVRRAALLRVEDEEVLRRLAKELRGKDKTNAKLADELHTSLQKMRQRRERRERVLNDLQDLALQREKFDESDFEELVEEWKSLSGDADPALQKRFKMLYTELQPILVEHRRIKEEQQKWQTLRERMLQDLQQLANGNTEVDPGEAETELKAAESSWQELPALGNRALQERLDDEFRTALRSARSSVGSKRKQLKIEHRLGSFTADIEKRLQQKSVSPKLVKKLREQFSEFSAGIPDKQSYDKPLQQIRNLMDKLESKLAAQRNQEKDWQKQLKSHIETLEANLRDKTLKPALAAHKKAHDLLVTAGDPRPFLLRQLEERLHHNEPALRELKEWRNWGTDHAREELVEEAEGLSKASPVSIEQLAKHLRDLRKRWISLGLLPASGKDWQERFDTACTLAYAPLKARRDAEAETRRENLELRRELCKRLELLCAETNWDEADWRTLNKTIGETRRQWRNTGGVSHKAWPEIRRRFDRASKKLDDKLQPEREANFHFRQGLVRKAEALAQEEDNRTAVAAARELRKEWQITVHSHNRKEQELWQTFNSALDNVFQQERSARDKFFASLEENQREAESLCEKLETLAKGNDEAVRSYRSEMKQLVERFSTLGNLPRQSQRRLENRFDNALKVFRQRIRKADSTLRGEQLKHLYTLHRIAVEAETQALGNQPDPASADRLKTSWSDAEKPHGEKTTLLDIETRFQNALATIKSEQSAETLGDLEGNLSEKERVCTDLEILLGMDSPPAAQDQRMRRQMEILKTAMQGGDPNTPDHIRGLQLAYLSCGPTEPSLHTALEKRFAEIVGKN